MLSLACLSLLLPAGGAAATRGAPLSEASTLDLPATAGHVPDSIIRGKRLGRIHSRSAGYTSYPVLGGEQVQIYSIHYSDAEKQRVADVLGGLVHGPEMNTLSVYLASPEELAQICGPSSLACYAPAIGEMIVSGVDGSSYGVPRDYTIAHEYGHHIANNRANSPWAAIDSGAKRWATYERVCQGIRRGQLHPGDEGYHYWDNPGEGFAEATAHLNFPDVYVPWGYNSLLRPTAAALTKLRLDITHPWAAPTTVTWNGRLWPRRRNPAIRRFATPLDGQLQINLNGPEGSNYDLVVLGPKLRLSKRHRKLHRKLRKLHRKHHGNKRWRRHLRRHHRRGKVRRRVLRRAASPGPSEKLDMTLCGRQAIRVEVRRRSGTGPFTVSVTRP